MSTEDIRAAYRREEYQNKYNLTAWKPFCYITGSGKHTTFTEPAYKEIAQKATELIFRWMRG